MGNTYNGDPWNLLNNYTHSGLGTSTKVYYGCLSLQCRKQNPNIKNAPRGRFFYNFAKVKLSPGSSLLEQIQHPYFRKVKVSTLGKLFFFLSLESMCGGHSQLVC